MTQSVVNQLCEIRVQNAQTSENFTKVFSMLGEINKKLDSIRVMEKESKVSVSDVASKACASDVASKACVSDVESKAAVPTRPDFKLASVCFLGEFTYEVSTSGIDRVRIQKKTNPPRDKIVEYLIGSQTFVHEINQDGDYWYIDIRGNFGSTSGDLINSARRVCRMLAEMEPKNEKTHLKPLPVTCGGLPLGAFDLIHEIRLLYPEMSASCAFRWDVYRGHVFAIDTRCKNPEKGFVWTSDQPLGMLHNHKRKGLDPWWVSSIETDSTKGEFMIEVLSGSGSKELLNGIKEVIDILASTTYSAGGPDKKAGGPDKKVDEGKDESDEDDTARPLTEMELLVGKYILGVDESNPDPAGHAKDVSIEIIDEMWELDYSSQKYRDSLRSIIIKNSPCPGWMNKAAQETAYRAFADDTHIIDQFIAAFEKIKHAET